MNKIITIGREFGSGGRELGRRLSETLGYAYYDQEIVAEIAKRTELSEQYVREIEEHHTMFSYPIHIGRTLSTGFNSVVEQHTKIYGEQSRILREMAEKSDCVIVGRCADFVLADKDPFRIFVYADLESKLARCRAKAPENEGLTDRELKQKIAAVDKGRAKYCAFLTGRDWGSKLNFDLCVNTTKLVIKEIVPVLEKLFQ